jgi:hypothetical protein
VQESAKGAHASEDTLPPGTELPFAWDEPTQPHTLAVTAVLRTNSPNLATPATTRQLNIDMLASKEVPPMTIKGAQSCILQSWTRCLHHVHVSCLKYIARH